MIKNRKSWDTAVKHYYRLGLEDSLPSELKKLVSSTNKSRWKKDPEKKYTGCEVTDHVKQDLELYKRIGQTHQLKRINASYFKLCDTLYQIVSKVKGVKNSINREKELIVNSIEQIKHIIPIDKALKVFNLSRTTYQNYKSIIIHQCERSYFKWCTKRFPNQLLPKEVETIKDYLENEPLKHWSKISIYLKAVRDGNIHCSSSTFYNYCRLLGFNNRRFKRKSDSYNPVKTDRPNQLWCADVTIFKAMDGTKHFIHLLMDHFSKMILGYRVEKNNSAHAIKAILKGAHSKYKPIHVELLTDGGVENVNSTVCGYLNSLCHPIKHIIAQKDVVFSNSMVEALNKTIKHEFLYPQNILNGSQLLEIMDESVSVYNSTRPQKSLGGNTPFETHNGTSIDWGRYTASFTTQKTIRISQNQKNNCKVCS